MVFDLSSTNSEISSSNDIIRHLEPTIIPRVGAIAKMALCERAAYNISFFGMESNEYTASGEIGNAVHRITVKSMLEIINLSKRGHAIEKEHGIGIFEHNAKVDIDTNWKRFLLAGVDKPFDPIMDDLYTRGDRLVDKLIVDESENKQSVIRPEFTIRDIHIPLEGRLDLIKIRIPYVEQNSYISSESLQNLEKNLVQVTQIKTGRFKTPSSTWKLQADAEALLLMKALNLQSPPEYIWQFADRDSHRKKFNFTRVYESIDKYVRFWKSEISPAITGYCQNCSLKEGCLDWAFAHSSKLNENEIVRRRTEFNVSKRIREEISHEDRWKVYVDSRNAKQRQAEGSAITNLTLITETFDFHDQTVTLMGDESFGQFIDFSVGDQVTVSDGNPNLGSNPTATIIDINLASRSVKLRFHRGDMYYLMHENRHQFRMITIDRFNFSGGLTSMRFLDNFFRRSPYADVILQYRNSIPIQKITDTIEEQKYDHTDLMYSKRDKQKDFEHKVNAIEEEYDI
ncbi:MAG: hypothetical protein WAL66_18570 [Nitrososphaeraceae archaeon]